MFLLDQKLLSLLANSDAIAESVQRIASEGQTSKMDGNENNDEGDIYALATRVGQILQKIRESSSKNQKKQR